MAREVRLDLGRVDAEVGGECCQCPIGDVLCHRDRHEVVGDVSAVTEPVFGVGDVFAVHYTVRGQSVRWHWHRDRCASVASRSAVRYACCSWVVRCRLCLCSAIHPASAIRCFIVLF